MNVFYSLEIFLQFLNFYKVFQQNGIFYEWYRWEILLCRMTNDEGFYLTT